MGISNAFSNVLGSSTWAEIYGVKYIGSIKAMTTGFMVFSTAFGTAIFGLLIDNGFSIKEIAIILGIYILTSIISLLIILLIGSFLPLRLIVRFISEPTGPLMSLTASINVFP